MPWNGVPAKTPDGQTELAQRTRGLSQRHRTALFLVDGRRAGAEVLALGEAAGVPRTVFDELVEMGLVQAAAPRARRRDAPVPEPVPLLARVPPPPAEAHQHIDLPLGDPPESSILPAAASLLPESAWTPLDSQPGALGDGPLHEARELVLRLLRAEAPLSGTLMQRRVRRAQTREELEAMIDEVERRLRRPRRMIVVAQTLRHVRHLLSLPAAALPVRP